MRAMQTPRASGPPLGFTLGPGLDRAFRVRPYERRPRDPVARPLRVYTGDPAESVLAAAVAVAAVPYEPLAPGPTGAIFEVVGEPPAGDAGGGPAAAVDLEDPRLLMTQGVAPSATDPDFAHQMVYAVAVKTYAAFRRALGRELGFAFDGAGGGPLRLRLRPRGMRERNAFYERGRGEVAFGFFRAGEAPAGRNLPGGEVYSALSHDIVTHETAHALLDGLRPHFAVPSNPDVPAFHEGFADLVAVLQHFGHREVVRQAIAASRGELGSDRLTEIARQFGHTTGSGGRALRTAVAPPEEVYRPELECHRLGSVLLSAVFDAFRAVYARKVHRYLVLATGGSGVPRPGELPPALVDVLTEEAVGLAEQFLAIVIRAVDYCPPVDVQFGSYLRALITADGDLVPDDGRWGYREAFVDAFGARRIYPADTTTLSEDALRWRSPRVQPGPIRGLSFAQLAFEGEPGRPMGPEELQRQAFELGRTVTRADLARAFGLAAPGDRRTAGVFHPPCVESVRTARRIGPDGQVVFDLVAEVTQRRTVAHDGRSFDFLGGSTVLVDPYGRVRLVVLKRVDDDARLDRQIAYLKGAGRRFWEASGDSLRPAAGLFRLLHQAGREGEPVAAALPAGA